MSNVHKTEREVCVFIATFNGERFLESQLQSILNQNGYKCVIHVIDDGSTDSTLSILQRYMAMGLIKSIFNSNRVGYSGAFLELIQKVNTTEWVCFSDQDDVWELDRLQKVIPIDLGEEPILVSGRRRYIDSKGRRFGISPALRVPPSWKNAIAENVCFGNTIILSPAGFDLVKRHDLVGIAVFDAWLYLLFTLKAKVLYVNDSGVNYRIHSNNSVGIKNRNSVFNAIRNQRNLMQNALQISKNINGIRDEEFLQYINSWTRPAQRRSLLRGFQKTSSDPFCRQNRFDEAVLRVLRPWINQIIKSSDSKLH